MSHLNYLGVLAFIAICAVGVNLGFRIRIFKRWKTFLLADAFIVLVYVSWDIWASQRKAWYFDDRQIVGLKLFGVLPIEELLFFIIVPLIVVLSYLSLMKIIQWSKSSGIKRERAR